jgi:carboxylesterase
MKGAYLPGAEPFVLEGGESGVLLFHGFSGSCFEVRALGGELNAAGFGVLAPALAGHGTSPEDLAGVTCDDFFAHAEEAYRQAAWRHRRLAIVGLSMGGTLGLHIAARYAIAGLVTISTPVFMSRLVSVSVPLANRFMPQRRVISNYAAWRNEVVGYRTTPVSSLAVFLEVLKRVRRELSYVSRPLLVIHSANDTTVPVANAPFIVAHVASRTKEVRIYPGGRHLLTLPPYLQSIAPPIIDFVRQHTLRAA